MKKSVLILLLLILVIASVAPYANAPKGYFIWDDINLIIMDYQIKSLHFMKNIFTRDFFGFSDNSRKYGYYRPLVTISYAVDWRLWGNNPAGYHWTNIIIHVLNTLVAFLLLLKLFYRKPLVPLIASLLFAVHPIHTESVTWIAGRTDPMCSLFFFLSLYFYVIFAERLGVHEKFIPAPAGDPNYGEKSRLPFLFLSVLTYGMSLISKEMAISLPIIIIVYNLLYISEFKWSRIVRFISSYLFFILATGLYMLLRMYKISISEQAKDPFDLVTTLLSFVKTITLYIWKMFYPVYLSAYMQNDLVEDVLTVDFLVPFAILVALIWMAISFRKKNKPLSFFIAFVLISFLPLSNFIRISGPKDMGFMSAERFLYLPSLAVCAVLGMLLGTLIKRFAGLSATDDQPKGDWKKGVALLMLFVLVGTFGTLTFMRNKIWFDNESFFQDALDKAPNAPILYMLLGNVYSIEQKWDKAEQTLKRAIEYLSPRDREEPTWIYSDLAGVYAKQGLYDKALETMKLASKTKFHNSAVEYNYGEIYRAMGNVEKAVSYYQSSLGIYRDNLQALVKLGLCYQQLGNYELSNKAYLSALNLVPNDSDLLNNIGFNYSRMRDSDKAIHFFRIAIDKAPTFTRAHANLGLELLKGQKDLAEAAKELQIALELDPKLIEPRLALGSLLVKKKPEQALAILAEAHRIAPKNINAILYIGLFYRDTGDIKTAGEWFKKALVVEPDNEQVKTLLAQLG